MQKKIEQLNNNVRGLVDIYVNTLKSYNQGNCLRIVLLNKNRHNCANISCNECNRKSLAQYRKLLLDKYTID